MGGHKGEMTEGKESTRTGGHKIGACQRRSSDGAGGLEGARVGGQEGARR